MFNICEVLCAGFYLLNYEECVRMWSIMSIDMMRLRWVHVK